MSAAITATEYGFRNANRTSHMGENALYCLDEAKL